ncbi:DUF4192 domain-containing protein [Prauserella oleivorans]|uniref:DUF4192 domain-containing protein n=1 Tax=Prauserella oleivorans TaxID=1478153 RepID=A0ABW5WD30_9PSEU
MTTSSTTGATTVDLRSPGQLIAAVPHLLGFRPSHSLLLVAHRGTAGDRVGHVLRADLPPPADAASLAWTLRTPLLAGDTTGVTVIVVGGEESPPGPLPPRRDLPDAVADAGLAVLHALWTPEIRPGARWLCYDDAGCHGELPDPGSSVLAAVTAHAGLVTYSSREAMQRQLDADDPAALARRAALLELAADAEDGLQPGAAFAVVGAALGKVARGEPVFSDREVVELARALSRTEVRDACLATALPPGGPRAVTAERLWLTLVRATPAPERAEVATLLAYSAYVRGDGPLAGMAVTNALDAHPGHVLAGLLKQALAHSTPPAKLARLGATCDDSPLWPREERGPAG